MIRLVGYVVLSLVAAVAIGWLISLPGTLTLEVAGYRMQPGLGLSIGVLIVLIAIVIAIWAVIRRILEAPRRVARGARTRRRNQGVNALSEGFVALEAGDAGLARSLAREAKTKLSDNLAAQLLEARANLALGDMNAARDNYRALIANPKTAMAALSGLYQQAEAQGRGQAALTFARKAVKLAPGLGWAQGAVLKDLTERRAWGEALSLISAEPAPKFQDKEAKKRKQAVLHTAIAAEAEGTDPAAALASATAALKLAPDFVPAGLISARVHIDRGEARKAQSLLRRIWRTTGHPHAATLFAHSQPGASAVDRLKRVRQLIEEPPKTLAAACVVARAAIDAYEWPAARNALAAYSEKDPTQTVCTLMAEIEEGQNGDQGRAREWLARAVRARRDAAWVADGIVSDEWEPVSPVTGKLDAFVWTEPGRGPATAIGVKGDGRTTARPAGALAPDVANGDKPAKVLADTAAAKADGATPPSAAASPASDAPAARD